MVDVSNPVTPDDESRFDHLCELEPRLRVLRDDVAKLTDDGTGPSYCANELWYRGGYKARLVRLVGHHAGTPDPVPNTLNVPEGGEPRVRTVADIAKEYRDNIGLRQPVHPDLETVDAYDLAYKVIYSELSDCRNCNCA